MINLLIVTKNYVRKFIKSLYLVPALFAVFACAPSFATSEMTWGVMQWPPFQYKEGNELKGFAVEWMKIFQNDLTEYSHKYVSGNVLRLTKTIHNSEKMCLNSLVLSEELKDLPRTSLPDMIYPTPGLIMLEKTFNQLGRPTSISLKHLLDEKKGLLGFNLGGLLGPLDLVVNKYADDPSRVKVITSVGTTETLMKLLKADRIKFFLDYPVAATYNANKMEIHDLVFVLTEENENFIPSYTYCSNNAWGRKMVDRISKLVKKHASTKIWQSHFIGYLDDSTRVGWLKEMKNLYD